MQLVVGRIGRPHGLRGDVSVEVRTDEPDRRFAPGTALATDPASTGPLVVESRRWHSGILLVRFEGVTGRDQAEELRGTMLVIDSDDIPPSDDPDEFYDHQLIGLTVVKPDGEAVGEVSDVLHHGQDLLVVRRGKAGATGATEVYVPFVKALVPEVDLVKGILVVDGPAGLLDPDEIA
ncbi:MULTISPECIES: ribosome maturation factor RimM [unclassified Streptosporangium]|uniref:ribosome maturation factor RimM n=1 Tax=unclassified Streptosporangium TaxID=2632669 RepID=UPI002E2E1C3C|nr:MULTISPECIES: ribosome maturation factor RimM [unclassified Streptosporangium]